MFSSFSDSIFLASSVTTGLAGATSVATGSSTVGAGATSTFGASVVVVATGAVGATFSVDGAVSNFSSLVCGADSPVVWTVGRSSVVTGTTPSAATAWA